MLEGFGTEMMEEREEAMLKDALGVANKLPQYQEYVDINYDTYPSTKMR